MNSKGRLRRPPRVCWYLDPRARFSPVLRARFAQLDDATRKLCPGAPVVVDMETGASDSKHTFAAGMPSYGVGEVPIDQDDIRAHGKDERLRVSSFYEGVEFFDRCLKDLSAPGQR